MRQVPFVVFSPSGVLGDGGMRGCRGLGRGGMLRGSGDGAVLRRLRLGGMSLGCGRGLGRRDRRLGEQAVHEPLAVEHVARDERQEGEQDERPRHQERGLVRVVVLLVVSVVAPEGQDEQARHVEGGHQGRAEHDPEDRLVGVVDVRQDHVLGVVARGERDAGDGEDGGAHGQEGHRHLLRQAAHQAHVVGVHRVDDRAGAEEQKGLEERVRRQVEQAGGIASDAERAHHEAELGDGREGQHALDVVADERHRRRHEGGDAADPGRGEHRVGRGEEDEVKAGHDEDAGRDHGRGVDEGRAGRRAFHRVGQPDEQRELGGLAHRPEEDADRDHGRDRRRHVALVDELVDLRDLERADLREDEQQGEVQAGVAELGGHKSLFLGLSGSVLLEPEADQEVGGEAHQLPAHEADEDVARDDEAEHRRGEEGDEGEVPLVAGVLVHVGDRVDLHHQADERHDDERQRGGAVDQHADRHVVQEGLPSD